MSEVATLSSEQVETPEQRDATVAKAFTAMGILHDEQDWPKVVEIGDTWLEARGGMNPTAATWYAQALMGVGRYEDAVRWAQKATGSLPQTELVPRIAAWSTLAQALSRTGQFDRARRAMGSAVSINADHAQTKEKQGHMLATMALCVKKPIVVRGVVRQPDQLWGDAWSLMESRLSEEAKKLPPYFHLWDGTTHEPVAVLHEQGLGDAVLTARWMAWLADRTQHPVTYYGPEVLGGWMQEIPGVVLGDFNDTEARGQAGEHIGAAIRCMSLPYHQRMRSPADIPPPWSPPSLRHARMSRETRDVRVGLCWKGAAVGWHDFERSYTLAQFAPIYAELAGVTFVNLAHEADVPRVGKETESVSPMLVDNNGLPLKSLPSECDVPRVPFERVVFTDVMHSGREVASCDIVVTVDTGIAHVAGSLGVATIVIPPTVPDWRWVWPAGRDTPFYKSVTVIRRQYANDERVLVMARKILELFVDQLKQVRAT